MAQTKTVQGTFQPQQISREDFIKRWASHYAQLYFLADTTADYDRLVALGKEVCEMAGKAWDRIK